MIRGTIGIDEAGRGPLAGPVAVGAAYIPKGARISYKNLRDSKKLTERDRELWFGKMKQWQKEGKIRFSVTLISHEVIDTKGIVCAISLGIQRCLKTLAVDPKETLVLLDGGLKAPTEYRKQKTIIKGDEKISAISFASIAAKVTRDKRMVSLAKKYPEYGFEVHKGYGTLRHRQAIMKYKSSDIHRTSFLKSFQKKG